MGKPVILIIPDSRRSRSGEEYFILRDYLEAIEEAGGIPLVTSYRKRNTAFLVDRVGGVLFTGGDFDIHPKFYRERPHPKLGRVNQERTEFEHFVFRRAFRRAVPILGICGGMQLVNVAMGGSLFQDIQSQHPAARTHRGPKRLRHRVRVEPGSLLANVLRRRELTVNSTHHQAVKHLGKGLAACAHSPDGLVEAIECPALPFLLGVQWHPERLRIDISQRRIFHAFVKASGVSGRSRKSSESWISEARHC